jgi:hypothetical protein
MKAERVLPHSHKGMRIKTSDTSNPFNRDHAEALESLRQINCELLVASMSDIPESVEEKCDKARDSIISAIRLLAPLEAGATPLVKELPVADFKSLIQQAATKFALLFDIGLSMETPEDAK